MNNDTQQQPTIPDAAVEAAVPRITGFFDFRGLMLTNEAAAKLARLTLAAAAPHLLAQGWDQGYKTGLFDKEYYSTNTNPYRA